MTTEEIITTLKTAQAEVEWEYPLEYAAAIDEAIEAVYVRDELIKHQKEAGTFIGGILQKAKDRANPKHYWTVFGDLLQCPVCKRYFKDAYDLDNYDAYCRHCGTKMEGIREE